MKRLIKFHTHFTSHNDKPEFSDCSSKFEVLPFLVEDDAGPKALEALAKQLKLRRAGPAVKGGGQGITHALPLTSYVKGGGMYAKDKYREYLAFIELPDSDAVKPVLKPNSKLTKAQANEIVNRQVYGVNAVGEHVDGQTILVKRNWKFYVELRVLGYHHEQLLKLLKAEDYGFDDDTDSCSECGKFNSNDNGYKSNFRHTGGGCIGIECGCYDEWAESSEAVDEYANNRHAGMELAAAKKHAKAGRLVFIERFIGGMTDPGRGGNWGGLGDGTGEPDESGYGHVRNGRPETVLKALLKLDPKGKFLFSHDDSGQFQMYFSVWKVIRGPYSEESIAKLRGGLSKVNTEDKCKEASANE